MNKLLSDPGVQMALQVIIALIGFLALTLFRRISDDIRELAIEVKKLNSNMVQALTDLKNLERRVDRLEAQ
jgi:hypothetical protein